MDGAVGTLSVSLDCLNMESNVLIDNQYELVDSEKSLKHLVDDIVAAESNSLFIDIEGVKLSRYGSISIIQLFMPRRKRVCLVDIHTMGSPAFTIPGSSRSTLRSILETEDVTKYFFDVRNDADALYNLYGIRLRGVRDIQLQEIASRRSSKRLLSGLATCITRDSSLSEEQVTNWKATKALGNSMFDPELGGSYEVFNQRPLSKEIVDYCIQDVMILPMLATTYEARLSRTWKKKADLETVKRLEDSTKTTYRPHGDHKKFGPASWSRPKTTSRTAVPTSRHAHAEITKSVTNGHLELEQSDTRFEMNPYTGRVMETLADEDWTLCDKDCGWCGHCAEGVL